MFELGPEGRGGGLLQRLPSSCSRRQGLGWQQQAGNTQMNLGDVEKAKSTRFDDEADVGDKGREAPSLLTGAWQMVLSFTNRRNTGREGEFGSEHIMFHGSVNFQHGGVQQKLFVWNRGIGERTEFDTHIWEPKVTTLKPVLGWWGVDTMVD